MKKLCLGLGLAAAACSPEPAANEASAPPARESATVAAPQASPPPASPTPVARIEPVAAEPGIAVPRVAGLAPAAARRINAVLDQEGADAVNAREACRRSADGRAIDYRLEAIPVYNADGLLSFRMKGYAFCGGANGTPLYGTHSFDTASGAAIDVLAAAGPGTAPLAALARPHYSGPRECRELFDQAPGIIAIGAAYLDRAGLGILYQFNAGAAESCGDHPAVIPAAEVRARLRLGPALARAWPDATR